MSSNEKEDKQRKMKLTILLGMEVIGWILLLVPSYLVKPFGVTNAFVGLLGFAMILTPPIVFFVAWLGYLRERAQKADELEGQQEKNKKTD